jgi:hypothetical protein
MRDRSEKEEEEEQEEEGGKPFGAPAVHPKRFIDCNYAQVRWSRAGGRRKEKKRGKRDESRRARGGK